MQKLPIFVSLIPIPTILKKLNIFNKSPVNTTLLKTIFRNIMPSMHLVYIKE